MLFYIDFENVGNAGLVGIEALTDKDCVKIYYSNNPNVDMHTVENIIHSPAKIQFVRLPDSLKMMNLSNALDIVLLTDISKKAPTLGANYAIVISNDKGFDVVIAELNQINNMNNVLRFDAISSFSNKQPANDRAVSDSVDCYALKCLFTQELSKFIEHKVEIVSIVKTSNTRIEINNRLQQIFDSNQSKVIMKALKPIIKDLPGQ